MLRKLIAVDLLPMERRAKELGFPHIPLREIREVCEADSVDVIEMLVTLPERQPEDDSPEALAKFAPSTSTSVTRCRALEPVSSSVLPNSARTHRAVSSRVTISGSC